MSADRELNAIEETAARWMVERDHGLTQERASELELWLGADIRHAAAFRALSETWDLIGDATPIALDGDRDGARERRQQRRVIPLVVAAAAAVMVAALGVWRWTELRRGDVAGPFALASSTEVGVLRKVPLPDGSVIQLNTDSAVDVHYTPGERRVVLSRGEAHFTVAKNADRPFIVSVAGVDVRVVGTVFNVRLRPESVDVLVTEGKVRVAPPAAAPAESSVASEIQPPSELTAGQKLSIGLSTPTQSAPPVATRAELSTMEIKQALAWQSRRLDFDAAPLQEIVAEMNRYNRHKLVLVDERLNQQRYGGSFPAGDCETIVRMLEANFGVVAERLENETRLRLKTP